MSLQERRHARYGSAVMAVRLVPLPVLLFFFINLTALSTQAFVPTQARPPLPLSSVRPGLKSFFGPQPSLFPRWPSCPNTQRGVQSTKLCSKKQQQDTPQQLKLNALEDLERRLKGYGGDEKSTVPFAYVTQTPKGKQRILLPPGPNQLLIAFSIIMALGLGALGQLVGSFISVLPFATLSLQPSQFALGALLALPLFAVDAVLQGLQEDTASEVYALSIFGTKTPAGLVLLLAAAVTLATAIGEEALFRGLIQQGIAQIFGPYLGLGIAAGVFGLAHKMGPSDVLFITLSGAYMGGIFLLYGDLTITIALHASYDFLILCGAYLRAKRRISEGKGGMMVLEEEKERKEGGGKKESSGGEE
ncbi:hypothetical protein VYU27_005793 [Nannochloropsis oceanica]